MKKAIIFILVLPLLLLNSCSSSDDTQLNSEADITSATIDNAAELLANNPTITNDKVNFRLKNTPENYLFSPKFTLSAGASIDPVSGTQRDFTSPQDYTVTSEDGIYTKTYSISFTHDGGNSDTSEYLFSFENAETIHTDNPEGHYHAFFDFNGNGQKVYDWNTGNEGFNILAETLAQSAGEELNPQFYPTYQNNDGYEGKGVVMQTKSTGALGASFGSPLAAGSLYVGEFQMTFPAINATHFGQPYTLSKAPVMFKGYFKYKKGDEFVVNTEPSNLTEDTWNATAILFEKVSGDQNYLNGDYTLNDSRIVSYAEIDDTQRIETDTWTEFSVPFQTVPGKNFDPNKEYMYTIILSSSKEGALYNGAVGSKLQIDEIRWITE